MAIDFVFCLELKALGAESFGVDVRAELEGGQFVDRHTQLNKPAWGNVFDAVGEFVVEVGKPESSAAVPQLLVDPAIVGARVFWADLLYMKLLDQLLSFRECGDDVEDRICLLRDIGLFDSFAEARVKFSPAPPSGCRGSREVVGNRSAWRCGKAEESVVFEAGANVVIKPVAKVTGNLQRVVIVAPADCAQG